MTTFTIDFGTGITKEVSGTLDEAKSVALDAMNYTQQDVVIFANGVEVTRSNWHSFVHTASGVDSKDVLEHFGEYGFYTVWSDEQLETDSLNYTNKQYVDLLQENAKLKLWCRLAKAILTEEEYNSIQKAFNDLKDEDPTLNNIYASQFKINEEDR